MSDGSQAEVPPNEDFSSLWGVHNTPPPLDTTLVEQSSPPKRRVLPPIDVEVEYLDSQAVQIMERAKAAQQNKPSGLIKTVLSSVLFRPRARAMPKAPAHYRGYLEDPTYRGPRLPEHPNVSEIEYGDISGMWASGTVSSAPKAENTATFMDLAPNLMIGKPTINNTGVSGGEKGFVRVGGFFDKFKDSLRRNRVALGLGAIILTGSVLFAANTLHDKPVLPSQNTPAYLDSGTSGTGLGLALPGALSTSPTTIKAVPNVPAIAPETQPPQATVAEPVQAEPALITFTIEAQGNLTWAIKDKLREMDVQGTDKLDGLADALVAKMQSETTRDLNTVYGGESFSIEQAVLDALAA